MYSPTATVRPVSTLFGIRDRASGGAEVDGVYAVRRTVPPSAELDRRGSADARSAYAAGAPGPQAMHTAKRSFRFRARSYSRMNVRRDDDDWCRAAGLGLPARHNLYAVRASTGLTDTRPCRCQASTKPQSPD